MKINRLNVFNYAVTNETIQRESSYPIPNSLAKLVRNTADGGTVLTIEPNRQPKITNKMTVAFWLKCDRSETGNGNQDQICWKGNSPGDKCPKIVFAANSNKLRCLINTKDGAYGGYLLESETAIKKGSWVHVGLTVNGQDVKLYLNGKQNKTGTLPGPMVSTISPFRVGGFTGKVKNLLLGNYAMSKDEIKDVCGNHPDKEAQIAIQERWKTAGCTEKLFSEESETRS